MRRAERTREVVPAVVRERTDIDIKRVRRLENGLTEVETTAEGVGDRLHGTTIVGVCSTTRVVGCVAEILADKEHSVVLFVLLNVVGLLRRAHEAGDRLQSDSAASVHRLVSDRLSEHEANSVLALCNACVICSTAARVSRAVRAGGQRYLSMCQPSG